MIGDRAKTAEELLSYYRMAHRMSCSDPNDPSRRTTAGDTVEVLTRFIEQEAELRARIAELEADRKKR